ncbi:hypothetical protein K788_0008504 [Paraburkholderia caribensis MBA4]|uniref:Uncharacterized protein n=1 Tax=Paraburkholderia caribensis MBA4 TaxID=1323664 RepID=A0A0P0RED2_9BURK|nr:hypothetical protein K788_0008504 [Paraburkholderia caribensis MBA4]
MEKNTLMPRGATNVANVTPSGSGVQRVAGVTKTAVLPLHDVAR